MFARTPRAWRTRLRHGCCATIFARRRNNPQILPSPPFLPFLPMAKRRGAGIIAPARAVDYRTRKVSRHGPLGVWLRFREVEMATIRTGVVAVGAACLLMSAAVSRGANVSG